MGKLKWGAACLVAAYAVFYWAFIHKHCVYTGDAKLHGRTAIITGANSGIGKVTALDFARRGARVILACRNLQKAQDATEEIKTRTGNSEVVVRHLELSSLGSVRKFAQRINEEEKRLDILVNNAAMAFAEAGSTTEDNFDLVFGVNHFGHFLLTNLLLDLLRKSAPSRVVTVSSVLHLSANGTEFADMTRVDPSPAAASAVLYPGLRQYPSSKTANILFTRELARRSGPDGVVSVSLHPGVIYSPIWKTNLTKSPGWSLIYHLLSPLLWLLLLDEEAGAQTTIHCALDESVGQLSGGYFDNCAVTEPSLLAQNDTLAKQLWDISCQATGLKC